MSLTQITQEAHDTFVRDVHAFVAELSKIAAPVESEAAELLKGLKQSLEKFHIEANKADALIQHDLARAEAVVKAADELAKAEAAKVETAVKEAE